MPLTPTARLARVLALAALLLGGPAFGWGRDGHRIIGHLAEARLSPAARAEVARLLAGEPEPTLAGVSTWADEVRGEARWRHTARWHWVNLPRENPCTYVPDRDCDGGNCVVGAIETQLAILADRRNRPAERRQALKFVTHFVGDVHQPFHAAFADDRGGNTAQIQIESIGDSDRVQGLRRGWNLHALWDVAMVTHVGLTPEAYAQQLRDDPALPPDTTRELRHPARRWALESCQAIFDHALYPERRVVGRSYLERHRPLAEQRMRQAGERLAVLLETSLIGPAD